MNKLSKEKRDHLILVGLGTLVLLVLIIYGLIRPQYAAIKKINEADQRRPQMICKPRKTPSKRPTPCPTSWRTLTDTLDQAERDMATGDPAVWIYDTIRNFKEHYKVDIIGQQPVVHRRGGFAAAFSV